MSAKEMFEELGFVQLRTDDEEYNEFYTLYAKNFIKIEFSKVCKNYIAWDSGQMEIVKISFELHKAIHRQLKELGWIED